MKALLIFAVMQIITVIFLWVFSRHVDNFRKRLHKGKICTFYLGEMRWMGEIVDFIDDTAKIRYHIADKEEITERPISEIYP